VLPAPLEDSKKDQPQSGAPTAPVTSQVDNAAAATAGGMAAATQVVQGLPPEVMLDPGEKWRPDSAGADSAEPVTQTHYGLGGNSPGEAYRQMANSQGVGMFQYGADAQTEFASRALNAYMYYNSRVNDPSLPLETKPEYSAYNAIIQSHRDTLATLSTPMPLPPSMEAEREKIFGRMLDRIDPKRRATYGDLSPAQRGFTLAKAIAQIVSGVPISDVVTEAAQPLDWAQQNVVDPQYEAMMLNRQREDMVGQLQLNEIGRQEAVQYRLWERADDERLNQIRMAQQAARETGSLVYQTQASAAAKQLEYEQDIKIEQIKHSGEMPDDLKIAIQGAQSAPMVNNDLDHLIASWQTVADVASQYPDNPAAKAMYYAATQRINMLRAAGPSSTQQKREAQIALINAQKSAIPSLIRQRDALTQLLRDKPKQFWAGLGLEQDKLSQLVSYQNAYIGHLGQMDQLAQGRLDVDVWQQQVQSDANQADNLIKTLQAQLEAAKSRFNAASGLQDDTAMQDAKASIDQIQRALDSLAGMKQLSQMPADIFKGIPGVGQPLDAAQRAMRGMERQPPSARPKANAGAARLTTFGNEQVKGYGGRFEQFNDRDVRGRPGVKSRHATGDAIDYYNTAPKMDALAKQLAGSQGVTLVIHNRMAWNPSRGWQRYTGVDPHTTHIHIERG